MNPKRQMGHQPVQMTEILMNKSLDFIILYRSAELRGNNENSR